MRAFLLSPIGRRILVLVILIGATLWTFLRAPEAAPLHVFRGEVMGTTYTLKVAGAPDPGVHAIARDALDAVDRRFSTYKADSELMRLNRHPEGDWFAVSPPMLDLLRISAEVHGASEGAFEPTVGPAVRAWGFGADPAGADPTEAVLEALAPSVGFEKLEIDIEGARVRKTVPKLEVDLSAIAKGYGIDRAAAALREAGLASFMLEVGGEVFAMGAKGPGQPWVIGIESPSEVDASPVGQLQIDGECVATSGDYRNYRESKGRRVSHLIDPQTLRPIGHRVASVTVVHRDCARADAWATVAMVKGAAPKVGRGRLIRRVEGQFRAEDF